MHVDTAERPRRQDSPRRPPVLRTQHLIVAIVAVGYAATALSDGGYSIEFRAGATVVLWWAVLVAIALGGWPRAPLPAAALVAGTLLAAFAVFTLASVGWASDDGRTFVEAVRVAGYLGLFALVVASSPPASAGWWLTGLALGLFVVACAAVGSRLVPSLFPANELSTLLPTTRARLSYPVGYWNGLGACMALAMVVLAGLSATARGRLPRALAVAAIPVPALALFLTSSRGGVVAAAAGGLLLLALGPERPRLLAAALVGGAGAAVLVGVATGMEALVDGRVNAQSHSDGHTLLALTAVVVLAAGAVRYLLDGPLERFQPPRALRLGVAGAIVVALLTAAVVANPTERLQRFADPPAAAATSGRGFVARHLTSTEGTGRAQFWKSGFEAFKSAPVYGIGAGGYEAWWAQHGSLSYYVRDAHSLFVETLGELGIVGFLLIAGFLLVAAVSGVMQRAGPYRGAAGVALALLLCGAVSAAIDWTWELPAAFGPVVLVAAVLAGPALRTVTARSGSRASRYGWGVATALLAWLAIVAGAISWVAETRLSDSRAAVRRGDTASAASAAGDAAKVQPWAAAPRLQEALVAERRGALGAAIRYNEDAIERAPEDWRLWVVRARLKTRSGQVPAARGALRRARELNPRSPLFASSP